MQPSKGCIERLTKEYRRLSKEPVPYCIAKPATTNILEWHFVITGAPNTDYEGGTYHGKLLFSPDYPFKPPGILFVTPSGRFTPNAKICFSFSDFHPEAWNPMWHVGTILNGVLSFMNEESSTTGSMFATSAARKALAQESMAFNLKNAVFRGMFPDLVQQHKERVKSAQSAGAAAVAANGVTESREGAAGAAPLPDGNDRLEPGATLSSQMISVLPVVFIGVLAVGVVLFPLFSSR